MELSARRRRSQIEPRARPADLRMARWAKSDHPRSVAPKSRGWLPRVSTLQLVISLFERRGMGVH